MLFIKDMYIGNVQDLQMFFNECGHNLDKYDIEEIGNVINGDELSDLRQTQDILQAERDYYEAALDSYNSTFCEIEETLEATVKYINAAKRIDRDGLLSYLKTAISLIENR